MSKLGNQLLKFRDLMNDTIQYLGEEDDKELYDTTFKLSMMTPSGKCAVLYMDMGAEIWELIEDTVKDYADIMCNSYGSFEGEELKEIRQTFKLDYTETVTEYNKETDTTYIWDCEYKKGELKSRIIKGWYMGEPNTEDTSSFYGSLKAEF